MQFVPGKMMKKKSAKKTKTKGICPSSSNIQKRTKDGSQICRQCCYRRQFSISRRYTLILINGIVQGAGNNQRIGNKVSLKALRMKGQIINLATAVQTYARLLVVYDKQPNGALPTYATVMQTRDNAGAASNTAFSDPNFDNKERFTILRDTTFVLPSVTNTVGVLTNVGFDQGTKNDINIFNVDMYIKLKGLHTAYTGATAGIADISTGSLFFGVIIHQGAAT